MPPVSVTLAVSQFARPEISTRDAALMNILFILVTLPVFQILVFPFFPGVSASMLLILLTPANILLILVTFAVSQFERPDRSARECAPANILLILVTLPVFQVLGLPFLPVARASTFEMSVSVNMPVILVTLAVSQFARPEISVSKVAPVNT